MNASQINNLKNLIQTSNILSGNEKNEWLALLELMDDKQLGELEKILLIGRKQTEQKAEPKLQAINLPNITPPISPLKPQMPKLSHIVNLPRIGNVSKNNEPKLAVEPPKPVVKIQANQVIQNTKVATQKKATGFLAKLKNMLAEKELPAGHAQNQLELTAKATTQVHTEPVSMPKPVIKLPPPIIPKPKVIIAEKVILEGPIIKPESKLEEPLTVKTSGIIQRPTITQPLKVARPPENISGYKPQNQSKPQSGVNFTKSSEGDKNKILSEIKSHLDQKPTLEASVLTPKSNFNPIEERLNTDIILETLEDLVNLNKKLFTTSDFNTVVKKIKLLVQKSGYHTVVFNIEQSQLYKAYIKTGLEILDNKTSFELKDKEVSEIYLNRHAFEQFTDLLRQIQVS